MAHAKPQVVIDLQEYNDLLKAKADADKGDIVDYQKALAIALGNLVRSGQGLPQELNRQLEYAGLKMAVSGNVGSDAMRVLVTKIDPTKNGQNKV